MGLDDTALAIRSVASLQRVEPLEAVAEVVPESDLAPRVSVRVEVVAAEPAAPPAPKSLPSAPHATLEPEAAQLIAARTAARLARARATSAYAAARDLFEAAALERGVCIHAGA